MKIVGLLTFACIATLISSSYANNVTWGFLTPYSRVVETRRVRVDSSILRVKDEVIQFPGKGIYNFTNLTAVRVTDHQAKNGGVAEMTNGGPYYPYCEITLTSARGHGLNYTIQYFVDRY